MLRRQHIAGCLLFLIAPPLFAHDVITTKLTYTRDISRIFARHCVACHGASASVSLSNYSEVRPWAVSIKEQVLGRSMPPWGAVKGFGDLAPDRGLTEEELLIVSSWVVGGAPEGDPAALPKNATSSQGHSRPAVRPALRVETQAVTDRQLSVSAVKPLATSLVKSARLTATLPSGEIRPLVWLWNYSPETKGDFRFRSPLVLPAGTMVKADCALTFELESTVR